MTVPSLLIKVRKARWHKNPIPAFIPANDAPADCLTDLRIDKNELSVWEILDDNSNLQRVLTALAANGTTVSNIDYLLFDRELAVGLGLNIKKSVGATLDDHANHSWHHDITELSARSAANLAVAIFHNSRVERKPEKLVLGWLKAAATNNEIFVSRLHPNLAAKLSLGAGHQ